MRRGGKLLGFAGVCLCFLMLTLITRGLLLLAPSHFRKQVFARLTTLWAQSLLPILGIKVTPAIHPPARPSSGHLLVSNHQSYLDILIIASLFPAQFVAKQEVRRWPVLGLLAILGGTIFLDRRSKRSGLRCANQVCESLRDGVNVQVFPEGTSTDGREVLPFKPLLFSAAVKAQAPVLPCTINYVTVDGQAVSDSSRDRVCWYGGMNFIGHFWRLLDLRSVGVELTAHELIAPPHTAPVQEVARLAHRRVTSGCSAPQVESTEAPFAVEFIAGAILYSLPQSPIQFVSPDIIFPYNEDS